VEMRKPTGLSGLQREVLSLYRDCLRAAKKKGPASGFEAMVKTEFRHYATEVPRSSFKRIESLIRTGKKRLEMMSSPHVSSISRVNPH
jgi:succinate dehydrogenase assembly factor 1